MITITRIAMIKKEGGEREGNRNRIEKIVDCRINLQDLDTFVGIILIMVN